MENCPQCGEYLKTKIDELIEMNSSGIVPNSDTLWTRCPNCKGRLRVTVRAEPVYTIEVEK